MRKIFVLVLVLLVSYGAYHFLSGNGANEGAGMMGDAMPVGVAPAEEKDVTLWDEFSGRLMAVDRVEIRPRVSGTVDTIHFTEGQMVSKGDKLMTIDPKPYDAALQSARARSSFAESEFARAKTLLPEKAISQREFDDKKNAVEVARADLTKAQLDLGYTQIVAPVDGRVSRAEITVGNLVNSGGQTPILTTIVSLDPIYADFDVDEQSYVKYLAANGNDPQKLVNIPVQLALAGQTDFPYSGHIQSFDNELNTRAGTVRARAVFENKTGTLIPGLFAHVRVAGSGSAKALVINERAISTDQNKKFVYVLDADKKAQYRAVTLGAATGGMRVIIDGVKPGETIVVNGVQRVQPGAAVTPMPVSMETLAPLNKDSGAGGQDLGDKKTDETIKDKEPASEPSEEKKE